MHAESWKPILEQALERGDATMLARVPKTDLHCHALLSAPFETYAAILGRPLPPPPRVFGNFRAFANYITANLLPAMPEPGAVRTLVGAALDRLVAEGVVYAEMSFDLLVPEFIGLSAEEFAAIVSAECERVAGRLHLAPEIGIARGLPADEVEPRLRRWIATGVWRSIDLYDDETVGTLSDVAPLYRYAAEHGLKLKAHAGELCGAQAVRDSVELLDLHAVQHGVRAADDPHVVAFLAERGTLLHLCPTSNYSLGLCESLETHPARYLFDQGVKITVNSDDYTLFGAGASDELLTLSRMGFSADEIEQVIQNGLAEIPGTTRTTTDV